MNKDVFEKEYKATIRHAKIALGEYHEGTNF